MRDRARPLHHSSRAGITKDGLFVRMSDEDWDAVLEVNLTAVFRLTRELTPRACAPDSRRDCRGTMLMEQVR